MALTDREIDWIRPLAERLMRRGSNPGDAWARAFRERSNATSLVRRKAEALIEAGMGELAAWETAISHPAATVGASEDDDRSRTAPSAGKGRR